MGRDLDCCPLMSDRNQMNSFSPHDDDLEVTGSLASDILASIAQPETTPVPDKKENHSIDSVATDVERFARMWITRVRTLIHRSTQLVERETMLAGAIARLNQQQADWTRKTAAKDAELREQSKLLTEAWLDVEDKRRKALQGSRTANLVTDRPGAGTVAAGHLQTPLGSPIVQPGRVSTNNVSHRVQSVPVAAPHEVQTAPQTHLQGDTPVGPPAGPAPPALRAPLGMAPAMQPVVPQGAPIDTRVNHSAETNNQEGDPDEAQELATQERLEEFKRMQRALRANRNS